MCMCVCVCCLSKREIVIMMEPDYLIPTYGMFQQLQLSNGTGYIPEMEQIISLLERGTLVTKFSWRKKPESKTLAIRRETRQLIWTRPTTSTCKPNYEGTIDLAEIKEVRLGKNSKDFEKWPDEAKLKESKKCFVVFYGSEFKLRVLSITALSEEERRLWVKGLNHLVKDALTSPYSLQVQSWLRREFYEMEGSRETVNLKDLKSFLPRVNYKIPTSKLREVFNIVDTSRRGEIGFDDFTVLYQKLIFDEDNISDIFDKIKEYSSSKQVNFQEFQKFLKEQQGDSIAFNKEALRNFICDFLKDPQREVQEPYLMIPEFLDFLFSKQNDLWDPKKDSVYQDMTRPLSHYWIASSHNTYLTGDQFSSESSVEAYARCLRMGCRCIELDCWDGPDCTPYIFHGHTLTTKIKFIDAIRAIKEHAFITSEYPVILSIEDNCSLPQQRKMANNLQDVFGDMLLTKPFDKNETVLPSPFNLRHKIILKHKKLPEGQEVVPSNMIRMDSTENMDLRNAVKSGEMFIEDPVDKEWMPHFFVLNHNMLFYTSHYKLDGDNSEKEDEDDDNNSFTGPNKNIPNEELHFSEKWFHGRLAKGREEAEQLLKTYSYLGDGTFLVRASVTFVGEYSLSFWRNGQVNHCRIRSKQDKQQTKYYLIEGKYYDSLYSLITHYRTSPLVTTEFSITLREPVPQPNLHENEEWYHKHTTKQQAEDVLKKIKTDGAFLVRPSENDANCYTISFRADRKIKHCRIKLEGRLYTIGSVEFESLVELINYYEGHALYKRVKLSHPVTEETIRLMIMEQDESPPYNHTTPSYMDPSSVFVPKITVKAKYDYRAQRSDELSFCCHAIITNVTKPSDSPDWWRGDYGGAIQRYFPAAYVEEIERTSPSQDDSGSDSVIQGSLDMKGAVVELINRPERPGLEWLIRIAPSTALVPFDCAVQSRDYALEWVSAIREVTQKATQQEIQHREMERTYRIAKELSNIIIYCRSISFNMERAKYGFVFYEMSSFPETKAERLLCQLERPFFLKYHQVQFSRVYPNGLRIDSSNYNPINMWNCGSQMVALNYQTGDKPMQLNQAKFRDNGGCGYLLKPEFMCWPNFDPFDKATLTGVDPVTVELRIIAGRHLCRSKKGIASPFVEVEIIGAPFDSGIKHTTKRIMDNGFSPKWTDEICEFTVFNPNFALIRFIVQNEDVFGEPNFIGQATYPLTCIRKGYRSVWLKNAYSEDLELASLLVHISFKTETTPR
ncbi:1-phosphatidylinositol 4,5-bisphosphate phosphodiesterase gamma-1 isoform X2 [Anthonomus grandis grandis]|uniref:1-phosphatidylinositol 4,5-bisphosphate phosphodiesterase gamma-1 isoform X2 n=1 Tax=Anthonomus grandis grandis TaxID=2921223 RepID=UPI002165A02B|nr:1-phosphatidylinositol 4,5-bisphosphate phosphodiesterase gamma-1 isoform X2 [Anthonomus grandis grandis]